MEQYKNLNIAGERGVTISATYIAGCLGARGLFSISVYNASGTERTSENLGDEVAR